MYRKGSLFVIVERDIVCIFCAGCETLFTSDCLTLLRPDTSFRVLCNSADPGQMLQNVASDQC